MSIKTYDNYKESGITWLGKVPATWKVAAIKHGFDIKLGKMLQPDSKGEGDTLAPYIRAANIQWKGVDASDIKQMWFSPQERAELALQENDLLVSEGGDVGRACLWRNELEKCYFQNSVNRARSKPGNSPGFGRYWLSTLKDKGFIDVICNKSTIAHYTAEKLAATPALLPPHSDQVAIANFLDRETAKIDALIAEQQRLIELLQEKRQAVISHAVTKGLNPNAPMKDSGVEWLGEVPEHWTGCRFKHCLEGLTDAEHKTCPDYSEGEYLIIRTSNIRDGSLVLDGAKYTDVTGYKEWTARCTPKAGDIVFTREAPAGEACIISEGITACLGQRTVLMHPSLSKVTPEYLVSSIYSGAARTFIQNLSQGSTVSHLNMSEIGNLPIALPPLEEQLRINEYTRDQSRKFHGLMQQAQTSIKLFQERRSALISAAITGQIDVRGLVTEEEP